MLGKSACNGHGIHVMDGTKKDLRRSNGVMFKNKQMTKEQSLDMRILKNEKKIQVDDSAS